MSAAEQLLWHIHAPSYNTANINSVNANIVGHLHIFNIGKYKSLLPEVSGKRWLKEIEMLADGAYRYNE